MIELNQITTLFLAVALYLLGMALVSRVGFLNRFLIPAPVIGGLIFATLALVLKTTGIVEITLDTSLQSLFMIAFFTTVGLGASFKLIKLGGKLLVIYLLLCGVTVFLQNVIGVSFAQLFGIDPLLGVMAGAVSMNGGHGGAAAYGQTIENLGVSSALTIGMAAATLGLICGSLTGGPVARYLIKKHDLKPSAGKIEEYVENDERPIQEWSFMVQVALLTFSMAVGTYLGDLFTNVTGFVLPSYIGAMFVAVIVRNLTDRFVKGTVNMKEINLIGDVSLAIFLSMALMSIKLWEVADLALPLIGIILIQVIVIVLYAVFVMFRMLGKDYDAAVMISGFLGHGLGATPNAMANMSATVSKYGPSRTAFLVVPIVGAFLIDVVFSAPIIITTINLFK
ncbi:MULTISPECIES: sodium/glutamate symporter [Sporosarcina]|uniref:Sodium/glutamate symporter n=2 Tax=Sporosarcina newyorkensis TaxID=759851 RepID=A0A1T4YYU3_9BACL|nr:MULTISPECIES: sodium/glutamate symporter [Sporosarcina]EGQ24039.1 ESS family glutamate:sodium (Na+) symporter [Sporosarcina newyorkensis 2681]MBY0223386.1 sodium/glutamate symporter [Sporosarcina aquimarina]SKB06738.1 glutamate:Na+ symporter, ESS family [Sporosarcina newyorkensis]